MATETVNGARLYYQAYGTGAPGRAPIVLVHGSTSTGQADWGAIAPRLAAGGYRVIVPDCRGHGQSENPRRSYSFKELAADTVTLAQALGYPAAHLIGHSNGGNVVLVALLEHPGAVQTCIPQAANGYVSADLLEKEPPLFDPERVARDAPAWMQAMQALHGPTHGPDYWRDLLRLTVEEIVCQPNYTPSDLGRVRRPVLVVQGAEDRVNAPGRHAQYLAENIPKAELWLPEGVGHNVHVERSDEWLARVLDFLARRGAATAP
jgi:pimeloyl-ACP methyl ester carboxylesterase